MFQRIRAATCMRYINPHFTYLLTKICVYFRRIKIETELCTNVSIENYKLYHHHHQVIYSAHCTDYNNAGRQCIATLHYILQSITVETVHIRQKLQITIFNSGYHDIPSFIQSSILSFNKKYILWNMVSAP